MRCPTCAAPNPPENQYCRQCGQKLPPPGTLPAPEDVVEASPGLERLPHTPERTAVAEPEPRRPDPKGQEQDESTDVFLTLIPYKNPRALAAYYCGFFAL